MRLKFYRKNNLFLSYIIKKENVLENRLYDQIENILSNLKNLLIIIINYQDRRILRKTRDYRLLVHLFPIYNF